jgi:hypothetical protein
MKCLVFAALVIMGCAPAAVSTWKRPGTHAVTFERVAVIAAIDNTTARYAAEDQLAAALRPNAAVAEHRLKIPVSVPPDALKLALIDAGFDGAVVLRVSSVVPGIRQLPRGFTFTTWNTWQATDPHAFEPGYDVVATLTVYDLATGNVMLGAASPPSNPLELAARVAQQAEVLRGQLGGAPPRVSEK